MRQRPFYLAHGDVEGDAPLWQVDAVKAGALGRPLVKQGGSGIGHIGPRGQGAGRLLAGEGIAFDGKDVQLTVRRSMLSPQIDQGNNVKAGAKAQLADRKTGSVLPDGGHVATAQKHGAGFCQPVIFREIDVAKPARARRAIVGPDKLWRGVVVSHGAGIDRFRP